MKFFSILKRKKRYHWYNLSFVYVVTPGFAYKNCFAGFPTKTITRVQVQEHMNLGNIPANAVLISASYLGRLSENEFLGNPET